MARLNPEIPKLLSQKIGKMASTIRKDISILGLDYPKSTPNAVAQIYARLHGHTVMRKLTKEDKDSLPDLDLPKQIKRNILPQPKARQRKIPDLIMFETSDYFLRDLVREINRAYSKQNFTCVYMLSRKLLENLIVQALTIKFPPNDTKSKELYYDSHKRRLKDFSVVLKNLFDNRGKFDHRQSKAIERLYQKANAFKKEANDATHSLYFTVENQADIDNLNIQTMIELAKILL